jgi:hypothetical protein
MAKTAEDIKVELEESILQTDNTLDVVQGAIPDIFIKPQSGQLANASADAEALRQLFTLQFANVATDQEIQYALANYGSTPGAGTKATHIQYFMRFTKPLTDIVIPSGTLVGNVNGDAVYRVVNGGTIVATSAPLYYNATRKSYELGLLVEAVGIGTKYNIPANRVIALLTPVSGIDSTENRTSSLGGREKETSASQADRLKTSLLGINLGGPGGLKSSIQNAMPELVSDVNIIQPFEKEFQRNTTGPALDIYVVGDSYEIYTQTYQAIGGETEIPLVKKPATSVLSVTVNDVSISSSLINDTTPETGYSLQANDVVVLGTALVAYDALTIEYEYNKALEDVNTQVFSSGDTFLFNTDILVREPFKIAPILGGEIQALPSYSVTEVEQNVLDYFSKLFTFTTFTEILYPEIVRENVLTQVTGVQSFRLREFRRSTGSLSIIEPITYARNEISVFNSNTNYYKITVVS